MAPFLSWGQEWSILEFVHQLFRMGSETHLHILRSELPALAHTLITAYLPQNIAYNADFAAHPDEPRHHKPQWHQWGILTHTDRFLTAFDTEVQAYIQAWGMTRAYDNWMAVHIDGRRKEDLLRLGILYHDLGKFTSRHLSKHQHSTDPAFPDFSFGGHEAASEQLIHGHLADRLSALGYTDAHLEYIGRVAALHYEIAKIRDRVKYSGEGYSLRFVAGEDFAREAKLLHLEYEDYAMEVGLMYLGDSLAKTQYRLQPFPQDDTTRLVHPDLAEIRRDLDRQGLPAHHLDCVTHLPVSVAAVHAYLTFLR